MWRPGSAGERLQAPANHRVPSSRRPFDFTMGPVLLAAGGVLPSRVAAASLSPPGLGPDVQGHRAMAFTSEADIDSRARERRRTVARSKAFAHKPAVGLRAKNPPLATRRMGGKLTRFRSLTAPSRRPPPQPRGAFVGALRCDARNTR